MIISKRQASSAFCELDKDGLRLATDSIILKTAAISGCKTPQTEGFAEIISEQMVDFILNFGYSELTEEEVLLAFQINAKANLKYPTGLDVQSVSFSGNCMNVDYLSKVLFNYMQYRNLLDRKFKNAIDGHQQ